MLLKFTLSSLARLVSPLSVLTLSFTLSACSSSQEAGITDAVATTPAGTADAAGEGLAEQAAGLTPPEVTAPDDGGEGRDEVATEEEINSVIASVDDSFEEVDTSKAPDKVETHGLVGDEISHTGSQKVAAGGDVARWIDFFTARDRERFQRFLERGEKFKPQITAVLRDQGIPTEIYYQAMIESGFATGATSHAHAVGIWQFMKETGRRYGLRVDNYVDERRDPMRSTIAAALYLKDLYNVFQSWYLAIAAYNAGEGRIMGAIMRGKTRDFWEMTRARTLPDETLNYIPKFIAASAIGRNPKQYGFDEMNLETMPQLVSVAVPSPIKLADIATVSGLSLSALKEYNPHLIRGMTPPGVVSYRIWVPIDQASQIEGQNERLAALRVHGLPRATAAEGGGENPRLHRVAPGETLAKIAGLYGLSVRRLKHLNHLHTNHVSPGTELVLASGVTLSQQPDNASNAAASAALLHRYRVRSGDSLRSIARRFGLNISDLKRLNGLHRNRVIAGQVLKLSEQKG